MAASSYITSAILGVAAAVGIGTMTEVVAPRPISVHALNFVPQCEWGDATWSGCIAQDRTVAPPFGADQFAAVWTAEIVDTDTNEPVPWCLGTGSADYKEGRATVQMPLPIWTGAPACVLGSLPPGTYQPRAIWRWGTERETRAGVPFTVD